MADIDNEIDEMREADAALAVEPEAPEPEVAAAPEPGPEPEPQQYEQRPDPGYVPLAELQKERQRRRDIETRLNQLMGRVDEMSKARAAPEPVAPAAPALPTEPTVKWEDNPAEYLRQANEIQARKFEGLERDYRSKVEKLEAEEKQANEQREYQRRDQEFVRAYQQAVAPALEHPEFQRAYQFNRERRAQELIAEGWNDIDTIRGQLEHEEKRLAWTAMHNEINPAEAIWRAATARGYRPQAAPTAAAPQRAQPTMQPAAAQPQPDNRSAKLAAASRSLSAASGAASTAPSLTDLAKMSQRDFSRLMDQNPDLHRQVMGG